jgi:hypothetical protein
MEITFNDVQRELYSDPDVELVRGSSVNKNGDMGWADFKTGKKYISLFDDAKNFYREKTSKWLNYVKGLVQGAIYKHETFEQAYKGSIGHEEMEMKNLNSTSKGDDLHLAEVAMHDLGLQHGREFSRKLAGMTNLKELIREYGSKEKYLKIREDIADLFSLPEPVYAYAMVRGD